MLEERAFAFPCGGDWLYGILSQSARPARRGVLIVVGGPQYRAGSHRQFTLLARSLAAAGIPAMRFDYRGMGDSEGGMRHFESVNDDIRAAIDRFVAESPALEEIVLWGLCDGASAAAMYAPGDQRVRALALLNPWVRTEEGAARATFRHYYGARVLERAFWAKVLDGRFEYRAAMASFAALARKALGVGQRDDVAMTLPERMHAALRSFQGEVLIMLSGADLTAQEFADLASTRAWEKLLGESRFTHYTLPKADHTCSRREWHDQIVEWTCAWSAVRS
ncbi:hydrolase 1, exosortase A system-associated [Massilia solisilvae]|uniref:Hydrolase 1, exosortase A system-associated n=1 Tax=Massilia solisilvae TaxID=1811225 RepID=A0ABT2BN98_9BURK|nr:hydrolase 1, exosortase A system-associated [Massilia solisilvae]MCS0609987.1 hydrolase 1, exosortase A system-associated [Massilia solisilvae]